MNRLFNVGKVPCFVDSYGPGIEKRSGEEVKVLRVNMRVQPFDAKMAGSLDEGVGGDSNIRPTVFTLNSAEIKKHFTRHDFKLPLDRQTLVLYAAPDTDESRVALAQAKISGCYVRVQKDMNAPAFCFKATFGPVGRDELELIHQLHRSQTFVTFEEAEPILDVEDVDDLDEAQPTDADEKARRAATPPMWEDTPAAPAPTGKKKRTAKKVDAANRPLHSHQTKKRGKKR